MPSPLDNLRARIGGALAAGRTSVHAQRAGSTAGVRRAFELGRRLGIESSAGALLELSAAVAAHR